MNRVTAILGLVAISFTAFGQENAGIPSYSLKWQNAKISLSDLSSQCDKKPQTLISSSGGSDERIITARCNITLPIDKIQAVSKFPDKIVSGGTTIELAYSANVGAFTHTLHATLTRMNGYKSNQDPRRDRGIVVVVSKDLDVDSRLKIEDDAVAAIGAEIKNVLSRTQEVIVGKKLTNASPVIDQGQMKLLLPVTESIFLETIRKHPRSFGLDSPENTDFK